VIPGATRDEIERRLARVEADEDVRILFAIESGSRAWGFASPDSDFDVRFIYCRRADWYYSVDVEDKRDVIEHPIAEDIDLNGWDLRKALRLLVRSNPTIVEWLQSPIEYLTRGSFKTAASGLMGAVYAPLSGIHHYRSMTRGNYERHLTAETVPLKKYFYAMRPLLAIHWIERHGAAPPIEFQRLLVSLRDRPDLLDDISSLLEKKRVSAEMATAAPMRRLNQFIESELARLDALARKSEPRSVDTEAANALFRRLVHEAWPNIDREGDAR
jgi:uncharacterized protein